MAPNITLIWLSWLFAAGTTVLWLAKCAGVCRRSESVILGSSGIALYGNSWA